MIMPSTSICRLTSLSLLVFLAGCYQPDLVRLPDKRTMAAHEISNVPPERLPQPRLVVLPGDTLRITRDAEITVAGDKGANSGKQDLYTVRPDGQFAYPYIGLVQTLGRTPEQLGAEITRRQASIYRMPQVTVNIASSPGNLVFIGGAVRNPGTFNLSANATVEQAITSTGGVLPVGDSRHVALIRLDTKGHRQVYFIDYSALIKQAAAGGPPVALQRGDLLFVPVSPVGRAIHSVDLYLTQLFPWFHGIGFGVGLQYNLNTNQQRYDSHTSGTVTGGQGTNTP